MPVIQHLLSSPHLNASVEVLVHRLPEAWQDVEPLPPEDGVGRLQGEVVISPGGGGGLEVSGGDCGGGLKMEDLKRPQSLPCPLFTLVQLWLACHGT